MYNILRSMFRAGTLTDNAAMEAINGWIKAELLSIPRQNVHLVQTN